MRMLASSLLVLAFLFPACSGKSGQEKVANEMITTMESLNTTLASVKDEASAKAAAPKLEQIAKQMEELKKKSEGMPQPEGAPKDPELDKRLKAAMQKMMQEMMRIGTDPKLEPAMKALGNMGK